MWLNRAGRNETALTKAQIVEHYITRNTPEEELPIGAPNPVFPDDEAERDPWTLERYLGNDATIGVATDEQETKK